MLEQHRNPQRQRPQGSSKANVKGESNTKPTCKMKIPVSKTAGARSHGLRRDKFTYGNAQQRVANGKRTGMVILRMQAETAFDALSARRISGPASKSQQFQSRLCMCIAAQSAVLKLKPQGQMEQCMCNTKSPAVTGSRALLRKNNGSDSFPQSKRNACYNIMMILCAASNDWAKQVLQLASLQAKRVRFQ